MSQLKWVIVAELILDTGTERFSAERVRKLASESPPTEEVIYAGEVLQWGTIHKSIPYLPGLPQVSDAQIRIKDNYRRWRDLLSHQTPRRRIIRITILPAGGSLADYAPVFVGEVVNVVFTPAAIEVSLRDRQFAWLEETIPAMGITALYPDLEPKDQGQFIPIIQGQVRSIEESPSLAQGVIPLPHLGVIPEPSPPESPPAFRDRWAVAVHPVASVVTVYRREQVVNDDDMTRSEWFVVDPEEYEITTGYFAEEDNPFGRFEMTHTYLDFYEQQPEGTEIRADVDGIDFRGVWGDLPAVISSPPGGAIRNPIDFFINMTYLICWKAGISVTVFDTEEIGALREVFEDLGYYCDGAITQEMTAREWLERFLRDFHLDMFVNRRGLITLRYITDEDPDRPVYTEGKHILRETFIERLPEAIINQIECRFSFNNATGKFDEGTVTDNAEEQDYLELVDDESPSVAEQKIEKEVLELFHVRDEATAVATITKRMDAQRLGSFQQEMELPLPEVLASVELARLVGLTHSMGLEIGGYDNREVKILSLLFDLDRLKVRMKSVLRVPATVNQNGPERLRPLVTVISPSEAYAVYSNVSSGGNFADSDSFDDPSTFATCTIDHSSAFADYAQVVLHSFPEPTEGRTLSAVRIAITIQFIQGSGTVILDQHPASWVKIKDHYPINLTEAADSIWESAGASVAKAEFSADYTASAFAIAFPGGASDVHLHLAQWSTMNSGALGGFGTHTIKAYDAYIEYTYAD